jgi:hypothetical protein
MVIACIGTHEVLDFDKPQLFKEAILTKVKEIMGTERILMRCQ